MMRQVLTGLIGDHIGASGAPRMHQREADAQGIRLVYKLYDFANLSLGAQDLGTVLSAAQLMGFAGLNVTHPYKQSVIPYLDQLAPEAGMVSAVNTVLFQDGRKIGYNTDYSGFLQAFQREMPNVRKDRVLLLGAGGAGAAVAAALLEAGARKLSIYDKDQQRARALAEKLARAHGVGRAEACDDVESVIAEADGLVNATPVGMSASPGSPLDPRLLHPGLWLHDIIYFPAATEFLKAARSLGCRVANGRSMAVLQAAQAFELFTGCKADPERMLASAG